MPDRCKQELCANWSGDGNVCPCAIFDLEPERDSLLPYFGPKDDEVEW